MNKIYINMEGISNALELHEYLKHLFHFPDYYGMNLDALYDCLTDIAEYTEVTIPENFIIGENIDFFGKPLLKVFKEAAKQNKNLHLQIK